MNTKMSDKPNVRIECQWTETSRVECRRLSERAVNWRLDEAVAAGRAKHSATWKVSNVVEWVKVWRCTAMEDLIYPDVLRRPPTKRKCLVVATEENSAIPRSTRSSSWGNQIVYSCSLYNAAATPSRLRGLYLPQTTAYKCNRMSCFKSLN